MKQSLLTMRGLNISFNDNLVVKGIDLDILAGETLALVGESGSGKSLTALAACGLLPVAAHMQAQQLQIGDQDLLGLSSQGFCRVRGRRIGFVFQDPMSSLNPVMTIGEQIAEVLQIHFDLATAEIQQRVLDLLEQVEIPDPARRIKAYPHQLSGGQRQRVMIAMALAAQPELLIADEPTTALDVTIQAQILALLKNLQRKQGMALWLISHDLALVSNVADRIAVMCQGEIVELADNEAFFHQAQHPYSLKLLAALPRMESCLGRDSKSDTVLLRAEQLKVYYPIRKGLLQRVVDHVRAVDGVNFQLLTGKTLALVGESGCGKTTLAKAMVNLLPISAGQLLFNDKDWLALAAKDRRQLYSQIQIVFQDPFAAMNPRLLVGDIIAEGLKALRPDLSEQQQNLTVQNLLQQVGLAADSAWRYPHEFSGGQRQRICIARALAVEPKLIILDEPTSALDVSVQGQIIELLKRLQQERQISYLLITHNLGVVAEMAHQVAVMYQGRLVEQGDVEQVLMQPSHPYTQQLLDAVPKLDSSGTVSLN